MVKKVWEREAEKKAKAAQQRAAQGHLPAIPHQHWAPGHGLSPVQAGHQDCSVPQLPQFGAPAIQAGQPGRHLALVQPGSGVPAVVEKRPGDSLIAAAQKGAVASKSVSSWSWRNRWNLTPAAASALAMSTATSQPLLALTALMAVGGGSVLMPDEFRGRKFLSARERKITAAWAAGGFVWTLGAMPGLWGMDPAGLVAFGGLTGVQTAAWVASRRIRGEGWKSTLLGLFGVGDNGKALKAVEPELSDKARELLETWAHAMAGLAAPKELLNSQIVPESMREPNNGTIAFTVELRDTVHAQDAVSHDLRKTLERQMRLGVNSVSLAVNRDDSGQIKVTIVHDREALAINAEWTGELIHLPDGSTEVPFAVSTDGDAIVVYLNNKDGVEHGFISGTTGVGKSNSLATMVLPGVMAGVEVMIYVDGGGGTSAAHLAGAADWWAVDSVADWKAGIRAAYLLMEARRKRRKPLGLSRWRGPKVETDPAITLVLDEAPKIAKALGNSGTKDREDGSFISYQDMVLEILQQGRKVGVRVIELAQDALGTDSVGGRPARDLAMSGGTCIGHRPTGAISNQLSQSSTADGVDLRALPEESGWCAVWRRGKLKTRQARTRFADDQLVPDMLTKLNIRGLQGADAEAAAVAGYHSRAYGPDAAVDIQAATAAEAAGTTTAEVISIHRTAEAPAEIGLGAPDAPAATHSASTPNADKPVAAGVSTDELEQIEADFPELAGLTGAAATGQQAGAMNRFRVLEILRAEPEGLTFSKILPQSGLQKGTLWRALDRLAKDGDAHKTDDGHWHAGPEAA